VLESELELVDIDTLHRLGQELGYFPPPEPTEGEATTAVATQEAPLTGDSSPASSVGSTPVTELTSS
jgi:hypothetical protein